MTTLVLLPPSEGKAGGGSGRFRPGSGRFGRVLGPARREVCTALVTALQAPPVGGAAVDGSAGVERVLGVRGDLLAQAVRATGLLGEGRAPVLPTVRRYTGVVWEALEPAGLAEDEMARIVVPSALLGLTYGDDPVPDYRLKFTVRLDGPGRLDRWWRPRITAALQAAAPSVVVDMLPAEHAAAVDFDALARSGIEVVRVRFMAEGRGAAGHAAKAVKGRMARVVLTEGLAGAARFGWEGWSAAADGADLVVTSRARKTSTGKTSTGKTSTGKTSTRKIS